MQRNRSHGPSTNSGGANQNHTTNSMITRSRSASSRSSNTNSSSSGSSSSASSSSSSSSSGSDSSSSESEASRASSQASRTSRTSKGSQKKNAITPAPSHKKVANKKGTPVPKKPPVSNNVGSSSNYNKSRTSGSVTNTKTIPSKSSAAAKTFRRKNFVASSSESESGSAAPVQIKKAPTKPAVGSTPPVKNGPSPSLSIGKKKVTATVNGVKSNSVNSTGASKKVNSNKSNTSNSSKAASKSSVVVASSKNSVSAASSKNSVSAASNKGSVSAASNKSSVSAASNKSSVVVASNKSNVVVAPSKSNVVVAPSKSSVVVASQRKSTKSIFSPDNSSEDSDAGKPTPVLPATIKKNVATTNNSSTNAAGGSSSKKKPVDKERPKKRASPVPPPPPPKVDFTSSLSASSTASSSISSSDSSSDSENKKAASLSGNPKSPTSTTKKVSPPTLSTARKRPVTRRQRSRTVKSKTIPTTTTFNPDSISLFDSIKNSIQTVGAKPKSCSSKKSPVMTFSVLSQSQPHASPWDSDFSDEPRSLIRVPAKSSQKIVRRPLDDEDEENERKCPFPGCDSFGHLSGIFPSHCLLPTCPKYHGFSTDECKENAGERHKREIERKRYYVPNQPHFKKPSKLSHEAKNWIAKSKDMKTEETKDGLCSQYDLSLWNDALAVAAARIETEQGEGISHRSIAMGRYEMSCWCESPYAEPLCHCRRLFVCEFCLKPLQSGTVLRRHCAKCVWRHPPGDEIYRKDRLSVWEVDGKTQKTYCQNLCLLAKCFLDHKTLYLDVDPFLFYVMTLADSQGCHLVGYFSKEKNSFLNYNVSCILTLPPYQRQGFGRLLIDFSYLLTRVEGKVGSPEKPLSDLGLISYRSYWKDAVLRRMCACASREMNVKDLSIELGVTSADLVSTLQFLGMLKYWKGKHLVLKKQDVLEEYLERVRRRGETRQIDSSCLRWRPFQPPPEPQS